ncbi:MAG: SAM-dependent chlorinase/fluorinase [Proteobacteria bacterium]|nr:SAM-dependent chlorinase/fluorinase [Pseudomonadota bacterium]
MIVLFSDYGLAGPYIGQVEAVLFRYAPNERVINLFADVPRQNPKAGAYLLASYRQEFPIGTIFFCVVDPGVGGGKDKPVVVKLDSHWFVGIHNGLFDLITRGDEVVECWEITYQPKNLSNSFHGRDLYAPVCAMIANQQPIPGKKIDWQPRNAWPDDLYEIIYIDHFGNAMTGIRASEMKGDAIININNEEIRHAVTFSSVKKGAAFWYGNANGLVEIAVNQASAERLLQLQIGQQITIG